MTKKNNKLINILKIKFHSGEYRVDVCAAIAVRMRCVCACTWFSSLKQYVCAHVRTSQLSIRIPAHGHIMHYVNLHPQQHCVQD